jgi:lysophospholipase L1-like esterase
MMETDIPQKSKGRTILLLLGKGATVLLCFLIAALSAEWLARIYFPQWAPRTGALTSFWRHDSSLGWSHIPKVQGSFESFGFKSLVSINSKGFRDAERSYERDPKRYRIVVLGDSMVWGWGVQQNEIFTSLIEEQCKGLEVINLGVSGYGTDQELLLVRQEALRYHPDLVVLVVMDNDFDTNVRKALFLGYEKPLFRLGDDGRLILTNIPVPEQSTWLRVAAWPIRHSYLLNQAARAYEQFLLRRSAPSSPDQGPRPPFPRSFNETLTTALIFEIQKEVGKAGSELVLVLADQMGTRGKEMEAYLKSHHLRVLNLDPAFSREEAELLHLPDRVHWTVQGHRKVADSLLAYLKDQLSSPEFHSHGVSQTQGSTAFLEGPCRRSRTEAVTMISGR